jgi:DNA-damage-inducible protein J
MPFFELPMYPNCATLDAEGGGCSMGKTSTVRARIQPKLKAQAENVFHQLGLNATQAITLFYKQVELRKGLPFEVAIPSTVTKRTFEATDAGRDLVVCETLDEMFLKLGL